MYRTLSNCLTLSRVFDDQCCGDARKCSCCDGGSQDVRLMSDTPCSVSVFFFFCLHTSQPTWSYYVDSNKSYGIFLLTSLFKCLNSFVILQKIKYELCDGNKCASVINCLTIWQWNRKYKLLCSRDVLDSLYVSTLNLSEFWWWACGCARGIYIASHQTSFISDPHGPQVSTFIGRIWISQTERLHTDFWGSMGTRFEKAPHRAWCL